MLQALSLYLPNWPVDLVRRRDRLRPCQHARPGETILLTHTVSQRPLVAACCERANAAGVAVGMSIADARALLGPVQVRIEEIRPDRNSAALESLARWAIRFSPIVAPDPPDGLLLNVTGCMRVFGGERRLVRKVAAGMTRLGIGCRVALAPTYGAAWAVSRFGSSRLSITNADALLAVLSGLPVRGLRIDDKMIHALDEVGIECVGQLLSLPRATLPSRFGSDLLRRLDQATGRATETITPVRSEEPPRAERALDGPTTSVEVLGIVVRGLLHTLAAELTTRGTGVRRLEATFDRTDLGPISLSVLLGRPTRDEKQLWRLIAPRMERMPMGFGIDRVELLAARWAKIRGEQAGHWVQADHGPEARALADLCDTIANRIGPDRVLRVRLADTHIPERSFVYVPAHTSVWRSEPVTPGTSDRPSLLFDTPEKIGVLAAAGDTPPTRLTWRGRECAVVSSVGPERIGEAWWTHTSGPSFTRARDYFKVQDQTGRWLWVYRETGSARWFIHGLWA